VHLNRDASNWVAVLQGVHEFEPGYVLDAMLDPNNVFVFDPAGRLVAAPMGFSSEAREENALAKDRGDMRDIQHGPH
jgi:glycerol transport system ATP-binding protein